MKIKIVLRYKTALFVFLEQFPQLLKNLLLNVFQDFLFHFSCNFINSKSKGVFTWTRGCIHLSGKIQKSCLNPKYITRVLFDNFAMTVFQPYQDNYSGGTRRKGGGAAGPSRYSRNLRSTIRIGKKRIERYSIQHYINWGILLSLFRKIRKIPKTTQSTMKSMD